MTSARTSSIACAAVSEPTRAISGVGPWNVTVSTRVSGSALIRRRDCNLVLRGPRSRSETFRETLGEENSCASVSTVTAGGEWSPTVSTYTGARVISTAVRAAYDVGLAVAMAPPIRAPTTGSVTISNLLAAHEVDVLAEVPAPPGLRLASRPAGRRVDGSVGRRALVPMAIIR